MAVDSHQTIDQEIEGTRITIYTLVPHFLDPQATEAYIAQLYGLSSEQVATARAYVLANLDTVLSQHLRLEARATEGNPARLVEMTEQTRSALLKFKEWLKEKEQIELSGPGVESRSRGPAARRSASTFKEWFAEFGSRPPQGS